MASDEDVDGFLVATDALILLARQHLTEFFTGVDLASPSAPKLITDFYVPFTQEYGRAAASLGADYFDTLRAKSSARGSFEAVLADPVTSDHAVNVVRKATAPAPQASTPRAVVTDSGGAQPSAAPKSRVTVTDSGSAPPRAERGRVSVTDTGATSNAPRSRVSVNDASPNRLAAQAQRLIMTPARDTITASVAKDPAKARWARVPSGPETCAFCLVMASRGAVYATEKSAGGDMNRYHSACDCVPTPFWSGDPYPDSYQPDVLLNKYIAARKASGSAALKGRDSILTALRQQEGIR